MKKVKVRKLIEGYRDEVSIQFVTIGEKILKKELEVDGYFINLELFLIPFK